ncbi:MAG: PD-(D/E)XK nuclease family protein [Planctomycetes bacterium]|nr:PD-(D/E)XK nuclease family protein [Planctomycetota bacterium]
MKTGLSASRLSALRKCLRSYYYRYVLGLTRTRQAQPLRLGHAFHYGLELFNDGKGRDEAIQAASETYQTTPEWADATEWAVERETLAALLAGHFWRYEKDVELAAAEEEFDIPLANPFGKYPSRRFRLIGRIDAIVKLSDGRLAVLEYKTAGEDIAPGSDYWQRLRYDAQISLYVLAARTIGYDVSTVLYDVTRKPTIRLRQNETPEQYGQRLLEDIGERPDYYFQRREVPRLEDDLAEYRAELWQQSRHLLELLHRSSKLADPSIAFYRNVGKTACGGCEFADLCLSGIRIREGQPPPSGFEILQRPNSEQAKQDAMS